MNGVWKQPNSPRIERAKQIKSRRQRIQNIGTLFAAILIIASIYVSMWMLIGLVMLLAN